MPLDDALTLRETPQEGPVRGRRRQAQAGSLEGLERGSYAACRGSRIFSPGRPMKPASCVQISVTPASRAARQICRSKIRGPRTSSCSAICRHRGMRAGDEGRIVGPAVSISASMNPRAVAGLEPPPMLEGCVTTLQNSNRQAEGMYQPFASFAASSIARRAASCSGHPERRA